MKIEYKTNVLIRPEDVAAVFDRSGIRRPTTDLPRIQRMIDHANLTITAWDGDLLIGIARAMTDFSWCCYLSDLAVDREYQHQGIGRELVARVKSAAGDESMLLLLSAPEAMEYYPKIGMDAVENGWLIKRIV